MSSFSSPALCGAPIVTAFTVGNHWGGNAGSWLSSFGIELRNCISYILKSWVVWKMHFMYCLGILHCILRLPYADLSSSKPETNWDLKALSLCKCELPSRDDCQRGLDPTTCSPLKTDNHQQSSQACTKDYHLPSQSTLNGQFSLPHKHWLFIQIKEDCNEESICSIYIRKHSNYRLN